MLTVVNSYFKLKRFLGLLASMLILASLFGCSSQPIHSSYDPLTQARIRIYKGPLVYIPGVEMNRKYPYFVSAPSLPNRTIGMPVPKNADHDFLSSLAGNFGYVPYREYTIPANKELTIVSKSVGTNTSTIGNVVIQGEPILICRQTEIRFIPQAGKDYDFAVISIPFKVPECNLRLREFVKEGGELTAVSIPYSLINGGAQVSNPKPSINQDTYRTSYAMGGGMIQHSFSFNTNEDSPDVEVLDYQYGDGTQFGTHADNERVALGQVFPADNISGMIRRGDSLYVKWRDKYSHHVYQDRVDLKNRMPQDITDLRVHFLIKGSQLYVYLIYPRLKDASIPQGPVRRYQDQKQVQIYPDLPK